MNMEERLAAGFLGPTATGLQALLHIAAGTSVQDLNALWGGTRDRWLTKLAFCSIRSVGGVALVRFLYPGETGGASATNAFPIDDGATEHFLVGPGSARLDYSSTGAIKLWQSSIQY